MRPIYFDYNATTTVDPLVADAIQECMRSVYGNPGCPHMPGLAAKTRMHTAREQVAHLLGCTEETIVFVSCATEANNTVLLSLLHEDDAALVTTAIEHPSVAAPADVLEAAGVRVDRVAPDAAGRVSPDDILAAAERMRSQKPAGRVLISVMAANNETGVLQPVEETGRRARERGFSFHVDAAQAVGKIPVDVEALQADYLTLAGHKFHAPKGVGALFLRDGAPLQPLLIGGGQERGRRSGTENIPYMAGLGKACAVAAEIPATESQRQKALGEILLQRIQALGVEFRVHGQGAERLPNTLSIGFKGVPTGDILSGLVARDTAVSGGAACHGTETRISPVLEAMHTPFEYAAGTIRFSWGKYTTEQDVEELAGRLEEVFKEIRESRS